MRIIVTGVKPEEVVKEAFWLAYQACGGAVGMGVLQAREGVTRDQVWDNVRGMKDYPDRASLANKPGDAFGDFVFGRMMKLGLRWDDVSVTCFDTNPRQDFQMWCWKYPAYVDLVHAAVESLAKVAVK